MGAATLLKMAGYWHVPVFMKEYFPDYVSAPFARHHHEIFSCIRRGERGVRRNVVAPRGSAKSTCMAVIYPLHRVCYRSYDELLGYKPDDFILILSKSASMAEQRIQSIKQELELNESLRLAFGDLVGDETWGIKRLLTSNDSWLVPLGRGGQIRGSLMRHRRPSLIISDDLDDPETVENPDVRIKDHNWFNTDLLRAGALDGSTNFINVDTIKHEEAIASKLRERPGWETLFYRAIEQPADLWHPTAEELWKQWETLFNDMTLPSPSRVAAANAFFDENESEMMAGVEHLWEPVINYRQVREEICDVGYWAVLRELQNSCRDPSKAIFDMENAVKFKVVQDGLLRSDDRLVRWKDIAGGSVFLDWAGGKDSVDNAYAAAVCVLWEPMPGRRDNASTLSGCHAYVLSVWMDRVKLSIQLDNAVNLLEDAQATLAGAYDLKWRLAIEDFVKDSTGAIGEYVRASFRELKERRGTTVMLEFMKRYTDKIERIAALEPAISHGWLAFNEKLSGDYIKQMSLFPTADFVDGPDATEGACQMRVTEFQSEFDRRRTRNRERDSRVSL